MRYKSKIIIILCSILAKSLFASFDGPNSTTWENKITDLILSEKSIIVKQNYGFSSECNARHYELVYKINTTNNLIKSYVRKEHYQMDCENEPAIYDHVEFDEFFEPSENILILNDLIKTPIINLSTSTFLFSMKDFNIKTKIKRTILFQPDFNYFELNCNPTQYITNHNYSFTMLSNNPSPSNLFEISNVSEELEINNIFFWNNQIVIQWNHRECPGDEVWSYSHFISICDLNKTNLNFLNLAYSKITNESKLYFNESLVLNNLSQSNNQKKFDLRQKVVKLTPKTWYGHFCQAWLLEYEKDPYFESDSFLAAINEYELSAKLNPNSAFTYNNLALLYRQFGRYNEAIETYNKALVVNPKHSYSYNNLGVIYDVLKQPNKAVSNYFLAIESSSNYSEPYYNMAGLVYKLTNSFYNVFLSLIIIDKAINLSPFFTQYQQDRNKYLKAIDNYITAFSNSTNLSYSYKNTPSESNLKNIFNKLYVNYFYEKNYKKLLLILNDHYDNLSIYNYICKQMSLNL